MNVTPTIKAWSYRTALLSAAVAVTLTSSLSAQTAAPEDKAIKLEEFVTLGSRFNDRTVTDSVVPIDVLTNEELQKGGYAELGQALSVLVPSVDFPRSANTDGTDTIRPATLRNLGPGETLTLLDGKRYHTSALVNLNGSVGRGDAAVDQNTIPSFALSGAEVLRDGAAAQYGSDAIAGVINLRLRRDLGFSATTELGKFDAGDGASLYSAGNYGVKLGDKGGFVNITAYFRDSNYTNRSGPDMRQQYFGTSATTGLPVAAGTVANVFNGIPSPLEATFNRRSVVFGDPVSHSRGLFFNLEFPGADGWTFYANGGLNHRLSYSFASWRRAADTTDVRAIYPNGFQPEINPHVSDYDFTGGVKGTVAGWAVDLSETYGNNGLKYYTIDSLNVTYGTASPTRFYDGEMLFQQSTTTLDLSRELSVGLPAPLKTAVGGEYRYDSYDITAGDVASWANGGTLVLDGPSAGSVPAFGAQGFPGFRPADVTSANRNNIAGYVDVENQLTSRLDLDVAVRAERYSDAGNTETGKIAGIYKLTDWLNFRSSFSNGFRAPQLQQEYFTTTSSVILTVNGVTGPYDVKTFRVSDPAAVALGSTPLKPEKSTNFSAGFTATPFENFSASVDYYNIGVSNRIVLSSNFAATSVASFLTTLGYPGIEGGRYFTNGVDTRTEGLDLTGSYVFKLKNGDKLTVTAGYNYTDTRVTYTKATPANVLALTGNVPIFDRQNILRFERGSPMDKVVLSQSYDLGSKWNFRLREDWYGKVLSPGAFSATTAPLPIIGTSATDQWLDAKWLVDVETTYKINRQWSVSVGSDNVFNIYPSKFDAANNTSGTALYSSFSPFGFDGGFYYGRVDFKF